METLRRVSALLCNTCASSAMPLKSEMGSYSFLDKEGVPRRKPEYSTIQRL